MRETFCCKQEVVKGASDRDRFFTSLRPFCSNDLDSVVVTQKEGQSLHSFHFAPHTLVVVAACLPACSLTNFGKEKGQQSLKFTARLADSSLCSTRRN